MADYSERVRLLVEKLLLHRGRRHATCRVFPPSPGARTYSVLLEESQVREQFYVETSQIEQFVKTGNDRYILSSVRGAFHNLDRQVLKKKASRGR